MRYDLAAASVSHECESRALFERVGQDYSVDQLAGFLVERVRGNPMHPLPTQVASNPWKFLLDDFRATGERGTGIRLLQMPARHGKHHPRLRVYGRNLFLVRLDLLHPLR